MVNTSDCGSDIRGFDPLQSPHLNKNYESSTVCITLFFYEKPSKNMGHKEYAFFKKQEKVRAIVRKTCYNL